MIPYFLVNQQLTINKIPSFYLRHQYKTCYILYLFLWDDLIMSLELISIAAGIVITWLLLIAIIKILKTSITTILTIAVILFLIQIVFGIKSQDIWQQLQNIIENFWVTIV